MYMTMKYEKPQLIYVSISNACEKQKLFLYDMQKRKALENKPDLLKL